MTVKFLKKTAKCVFQPKILIPFGIGIIAPFAVKKYMESEYIARRSPDEQNAKLLMKNLKEIYFTRELLSSREGKPLALKKFISDSPDDWKGLDPIVNLQWAKFLHEDLKYHNL